MRCLGWIFVEKEPATFGPLFVEGRVLGEGTKVGLDGIQYVKHQRALDENFECRISDRARADGGVIYTVEYERRLAGW